MARCPFPPHDHASRGLSRWLPGIATLRAYQGPWLAKDLFAGIALTAVPHTIRHRADAMALERAAWSEGRRFRAGVDLHHEDNAVTNAR